MVRGWCTTALRLSSVVNPSVHTAHPQAWVVCEFVDFPLSGGSGAWRSSLTSPQSVWVSECERVPPWSDRAESTRHCEQALLRCRVDSALATSLSKFSDWCLRSTPSVACGSAPPREDAPRSRTTHPLRSIQDKSEDNRSQPPRWQITKTDQTVKYKILFYIKKSTSKYPYDLRLCHQQHNNDAMNEMTWFASPCCWHSENLTIIHLSSHDKRS